MLEFVTSYLNFTHLSSGIKLFIRCSSSNGFCHEFRVYLGREDEEPKKDLGCYFYVVDDLAQAIKGKWFQLMYDNLYSSVALAVHLYKCKIRTCATFRKNRRGMIPEWKSIKEKDLERGTILQYQDRNKPFLSITLWRDTKIVLFLSSSNECGKHTSCVRRVSGTQTLVPAPSQSITYASGFSGVDKFDSIRQAYTVGHASKKS